MIQKFKKWLTVGTVGSKFNLFRFVIIGELILVIGLVVCICNNSSLKKERDTLQQQIDNQKIMLEHIDEKVLTPLGLKTF